jgi:hypothetical protein
VGYPVVAEVDTSEKTQGAISTEPATGVGGGVGGLTVFELEVDI